MEIGKKIKMLREKNNISQEELAKRIGYNSRSSINKIEKDGRGIPSDKVFMIAKIFNVSPSYLMGWEGESLIESDMTSEKASVKIPILGTVAAGIPIDAVTDIIAWEEISPEMARKGEYYGLKVKGESMYPQIQDGDILIFRKQSDIENGQIAVVIINGGEATCKKVMKSEHGITLIGFNQAVYEPTFYSNEEILTLPVTILGLVVEIRRSFI